MGRKCPSNIAFLNSTCSVIVLFIALTHMSVLGSDLHRAAIVSEPPQSPAHKHQKVNDMDLLSIGTFIASQIFVADTASVFPTLPFLRLTPSLKFGKLDVFDKNDIGRHMVYGNSSNGLPERLQGIWWTDGLGDTAEAFSSAGHYDVAERQLTLGVLTDRAIALTGSNSTWLGKFWSVSGAALYNAIYTVEPFLQITLNEDITFGQILGGVYFLGIPIITPAWLVNMTMVWLGDDTWDRKSRVFFNLIDVPSGNYLLKRVITGAGTQGSWFNRGWLEYRNGSRLATGYSVFP